MENLEKVAHRLDVAPHRPGTLCAVTSSPSELLYCDWSTDKVYHVDWSTAPLRLLQEVIPIRHDGKECVHEMCCPSLDLLVVTRNKEGVFAYTLRGGELNWRVSGKLPGMELEIYASGITADEQGHLFVCDIRNRCVHMLSVRDGAHLRVVVREGEVGLVYPYPVAWHSESASLVVAHYKKDAVLYLSTFSCQD